MTEAIIGIISVTPSVVIFRSSRWWMNLQLPSLSRKLEMIFRISASEQQEITETQQKRLNLGNNKSGNAQIMKN